MRTIWRFDHRVNDEIALVVPKGSYPLPHVAASDRFPYVAHAITTWWMVPDVQAEPEDRRLFVVGTGNPCTDVPLGDYVGTVEIGRLVWHVFQKFVEEPF